MRERDLTQLNWELCVSFVHRVSLFIYTYRDGGKQTKRTWMYMINYIRSFKFNWTNERPHFKLYDFSTSQAGEVCDRLQTWYLSRYPVVCYSVHIS